MHGQSEVKEQLIVARDRHVFGAWRQRSTYSAQLLTILEKNKQNEQIEVVLVLKICPHNKTYVLSKGSGILV